jgi:VWFA-related protein
MRKRLLLIALVVATSLDEAQQPPQPVATPRPLQFGTGIEVINLNVSVIDPQNRYVTDLAKPDFAVFEDGVKQDLSLFTHESLPISLSLLIDGSASMADKVPFVQNAATRFIKTLRAQDNAQVIQFSDRIATLHDFTADHELLAAAIKKTSAAGPTALHNALYVALKDLSKLKKAGELRRLAIVLLTDGEDTSSLIRDEQVIDLAKKTEIAIYSISIRENRPQDRERLSFSQAVHLLTVLSRDTGGQVHFPNSPSELDGVYDRIAEELRTQYSIGYVSSNSRRDGKWRRIVVLAPGRESVVIRHRDGYYAPRN